MMNPSVFKKVRVSTIVIGILGFSMVLMADDPPKPAKNQAILVFGKLNLKPTADATVAENLLIEKLLPAARGIEGLKMMALKKMTMPGENNPANPSQADFVMMAEISDVSVFAKLLAATPGPLKEFGDQMKEQAGAPEFELYQILGTSDE